MQKLNQSWYETYQTIAKRTIDVQGHSVQYAQSVFTDGVETLKGHIEASQHWLQTTNKLPDPQESIPPLMERGVEAYMRNVTFLQRTFDRGVETFKSNTETMSDLTQTLIKKAQEQQDMFWS